MLTLFSAFAPVASLATRAAPMDYVDCTTGQFFMQDPVMNDFPAGPPSFMPSTMKTGCGTQTALPSVLAASAVA